ncbi:hypothetical protein BO82DRAFT_180586 [Aspergillus uvarum CBS 121591]|uniref:Uncharacterized protein n=1 Tax=Aspergillus uvarum CBS 121591 TaxID=1448315 RepID=A0A319BXA3_9EURO|nr:hypothetical protein BO82DRAFT_180586 [Aspergillus uvarum CBS 121591]PYH77355.1 hypothetical protein BO82DRAFT_180586 [Aspergillus uvarum CBS 121591]
MATLKANTNVILLVYLHNSTLKSQISERPAPPPPPPPPPETGSKVSDRADQRQLSKYIIAHLSLSITIRCKQVIVACGS